MISWSRAILQAAAEAGEGLESAAATSSGPSPDQQGAAEDAGGAGVPALATAAAAAAAAAGEAEADGTAAARPDTSLRPGSLFKLIPHFTPCSPGFRHLFLCGSILYQVFEIHESIIRT